MANYPRLAPVATNLSVYSPQSYASHNIMRDTKLCPGAWRAANLASFSCCTSRQRRADNVQAAAAGLFLRHVHSALRARTAPASSLRAAADSLVLDDSTVKWGQRPGSGLMLRPSLRTQPNLEEVARTQLPALVCSFPSEVHPLYEQLRPPADRWIETVAQLPSDAARRFLRECLLPRCVCRCIPRTLPGPRLLQAIKLVAWLLIADDDDDDPEALGSDYTATCHRAERIMTILTEPADAFDDHRLWNFDLLDCRLSRRCSRQLAALADLWREMSPALSPLLRSRFISSMADYLESIKIQALLRRGGHVPDMKSYMEIRRQASFTIPGFIIGEYASGIELDQVTVQNPKVLQLCNKAVDYISVCNDIFSCYKEISMGDYFNLPSILYMHAISITESPRPFDSFQDAVDQVAQHAKDLEASCTLLIISLKDEYSKPGVDPSQAYHIHAYADFVALAMSGALAWFSESPRYAQSGCKTYSTN